MAVRKVGQRTGRNIVPLRFTTGVDDIQAVTVWPPAGQRGSQPIEDTSTAREMSANGLKLLNIHEFQDGKWALLAQVNT